MVEIIKTFANTLSENLGEKILQLDTEFAKTLGVDTFLPVDSLTGFKI